MKEYSITIKLDIESNNNININNKYNKTPYNLYNDNNDHKEYINWLENIFKEIYNKTNVM